MDKRGGIRGLTWACVAVLLVMGACLSRRGDAGAVVTRDHAGRLAAICCDARNTVNLTLLDAIYDPAVVVHDPGAPADIRGLEALKAYYQNSHTGLPDFKIAIDDIFLSGDKVAILWTVTGTNTRPLHGIPPTGKLIRFSGMAIDRVADGKIVEEWVHFNALDLLQQLGFTLAPPGAGPVVQKSAAGEKR